MLDDTEFDLEPSKKKIYCYYKEYSIKASKEPFLKMRPDMSECTGRLLAAATTAAAFNNDNALFGDVLTTEPLLSVR
jgi:hypothetical protein